MAKQNILEQLFSSKTRVKLLTLFLLNTDKSYFVREITRMLKEQLNSVRRELDKLEGMGLIKSEVVKQKKFYSIDSDFEYLKEFRNFILKAGEVIQGAVGDRMRPITGIKLVVLVGVFCDRKSDETDMLIVGKVNKNRLVKLIKDIEDELGREVRYSLLEPEEYGFRLNMGDQFLLSVLNNPEKIVLIDRIKSE